MARIIYSALVDEIAGSIGGTTFQANRYGFTVKRKPRLTNQTRTRQQEAKKALQSVSKAWRGLTSAERTNWDDYAAAHPVPSKHNPSVDLTGFSLFQYYHIRQFVYSTTILTDPDDTQASYTAGTPSLTRTGATLIYDDDTSLDTYSWNILIYLSNVLPPGQNFVGSRLRYVVFRPFSSLPADIASFYSVLYGFTPASGDRLGAQIVYMNHDNAQVIILPPQILVVG